MVRMVARPCQKCAKPVKTFRLYVVCSACRAEGAAV